jgi:nicotinamidase-related amidase
MLRREIDAIPRDGDVAFRQRAVEPDKTALLVIDVQKGLFNEERCAAEPENAYLWKRLGDYVVPNGKRLLAACRERSVEVMFTVIECLTLDGRDRSLDYKISGLFYTKGAWGAQVIDELAPLANEIVIPKTSSSLFNSTNFDYVLRNLGMEYVMTMGMTTSQCVETVIRDGCDRGFLMTLIDDACAANSEERHRTSLAALAGYCRVRTTAEVIDELGGGSAQA